MRPPTVVIGWAKRLLAVFLAVMALAVIVPDIAPRGWPESKEAPIGRDPLVVAIYCGIAASILMLVFVGERRSRALEIFGWALLVLFVVLAFK
jgi:hypothetical protein